VLLVIFLGLRPPGSERGAREKKEKKKGKEKGGEKREKRD